MINTSRALLFKISTMHKLYGVVLLMLLHFAMQAQDDRIQVTDMLLQKTVGSIALNADGSMVAYTLRAIEPDNKKAGEYIFTNQIWVAATNGQQPPRQFTTAAEGASQPAWSPDGTKLAFVRSADGKPQIFIASMQGGEPVQLTHLKTGASNPVWSPDGNQMAFTSTQSLRSYINDSSHNPTGELPLYSFEKPGLTNDFMLNNQVKPNANGSLEEVRAYLYQNELEKKAKVLHQLNFQEESTTSSEKDITHVYLIGLAEGAVPKAITRGFLPVYNPLFVKGTPYIVVTSGYFRKYNPDRMQEQGVYFIDTLGAKPKVIFADSGFAYSGTALSPSGKWMVYQKRNVGSVNVPEMYVAPVSGEAAPTLIKLDRNKGNFTWSDDERYIYFTAVSNGGTVLQRYDMRSKQLTRLTEFDEGITGFDIKGNQLVFAKTNITTPSDLYVANAEAKNEKPLTQLNAWVNQKQLSKPEKFNFRNDLGQMVEYWVMKPIGFKAGEKYPLLLEMHGGPSAMWGPGEASMWHEYQYFCAKGYGVVYCNPRGSGGYGEAFLKANMNDWGNGPMRDVLTALDKTVAQGWVNTSKLLLTGGSYAGYLAAYILGNDQRFAAACAQRGVYDLGTFFGEGNAWRLVPNYFGGYPWEAKVKEVLERESPINYVQNIQTPLIIFHGEQDLRTGVIQGEQLYKSLKVLNRPVEYVRHPGATHEITRSGNNRQRIDQMLRTWEFFERFIGDR